MTERSGSWFTRLARSTAAGAGSPTAFVVAVVVIVGWAVTGPWFDFSDRWMWVIHTATSIATFLLVFLLHNTESRNTAAVQIKLDEIIRALGGARSGVMDLEEKDQARVERVHRRYERLGGGRPP